MVQEQAWVPARDGARLAVRRAGNAADPAVLLLHGYSLGAGIWADQLNALPPLGIQAVAVDLRGHGDSETGTADMLAVTTWADDVAAVIAGLGLDRPVVAAWSYGGVVLGDYLAVHGSDGLGGAVLVAAAPLIDYDPAPTDDPFFSLIPALVGDEAVARGDAEDLFVRRLTAEPLDAERTAAITTAVRRVPTATRRALMDRKANHLDDYAGLAIPAMCIHGDADVLMPMFVSERVSSSIPGAPLHVYEHVGHAPFIEAGDRFARDLAAFVKAGSHPSSGS